MEPKLSEHAKKAIANSRDEAIRLKNGAIGVEHLFLGILREPNSSTVQMLQKMDVDLPAVKSRIESIIGQIDSDVRFSIDSEIPMLRQTEVTGNTHYSYFPCHAAGRRKHRGSDFAAGGCGPQTLH